MSKTAPTRPGPVAYATLGLLYGSAFVLFAIRVVTFVLGVALGRNPNFVVITATVALLCAACALRSHLAARQNRAFQAELRAESERLRAEIVGLRDQVHEIEQQAWWNDPDTNPGAEDTLDLSNVRWLPQRKQPPESKSS